MVQASGILSLAPSGNGDRSIRQDGAREFQPGLSWVNGKITSPSGSELNIGTYLSTGEKVIGPNTSGGGLEIEAAMLPMIRHDDHLQQLTTHFITPKKQVALYGFRSNYSMMVFQAYHSNVSYHMGVVYSSKGLPL